MSDALNSRKYIFKKFNFVIGIVLDSLEEGKKKS